MDALKKAEQAKQQGQAPQGAEKGNASAPGLEPVAESTRAPPAVPSAAGSTSLPELPSRLEVLDEEFMADVGEDIPRSGPDKTSPRPEVPPAVAPPRKPAPGERLAAQSAAQQVFAAKQPPASDKMFMVAVSAVTLVAVAGIGIYFWLQLQPPGRLPALRPPPAAASRPAPIVTPVAAPAPAAATETAAPPKPAEAEGKDGEKNKAPRARAAPPAAPAAPSSSPMIRITASRLALDPTLAQAFDALSAGNLSAARVGYERVLKSDPRNADALHGMAAIALREDRPDVAEMHWLRALDADPKDARALAGLVGMRGQADLLAAESHLKNLLASQPDHPALHFALGNLYARQNRWNEAQQSYFRAVTFDPDHPDYLFNLAIGLDHLRQDRLAAQHYRRALTAAASRPGSFDKAQAEARLRELQP